GEGRPACRPERMARDEFLDVGAAHRRARLCEQSRRRRERRRGGVRRAKCVRRPERQHLPPRLAGGGEPVDEAVRLLAQPPARKRRWMQEDAARAFELHDERKSHPVPRRRNESPPRIQIQRVEPQVDCGRFPVKRTVGDEVVVTATIFRDGHDVLGATVRFRPPGARRWREAPLEPLGNDEWHGSFVVDRCGRWSFTVAAWTDRVASWQDEVRRKLEGGQTDLAAELSEGQALLGADLTLDE